MDKVTLNRILFYQYRKIPNMTFFNRYQLCTILFAFTLIGLTNSCSLDNGVAQNNTSPKSSDNQFLVEIPAIQEREGKLAEAPEWAKIREGANILYQKVRMTKDAKAALQLAAVYMQEARITGDHPYYYNAALDVLNVVIENPPKEKILQYQSLVSKASVLLSQHHFEEALQTGKEALKLEKNDAQVYGVLCDANVELGNYNEAVAMSDKMISIKPDLRSYARISYLRELHGDVDGAIEAMQMAVKAGVPSHENTAWARHTLAGLYLNYGKIKEGKEELEMCLEERPIYAFAIASQADQLLSEGDLDVAEEKIERACELMPEFSFYVTQAKIQREKKETEAFEKNREDLLVMMKEDTESGHNMSLETSRIYLELFNDEEKALNIAMTEYELRPNNIEINKLLGEIYFANNNFEKAIEHLDKASTTNWADPTLLCLKGLALCKTGNIEKGKDLLKKVINNGSIKDQDLLSQSRTYLANS